MDSSGERNHQRKETAEKGNWRSNARGTISSPDGSTQNKVRGEHKDPSKNTAEEGQQAHGDNSENTNASTRQGARRINTAMSSHNHEGGSASVLRSTNPDSDDAVTSGKAGRDDPKTAPTASRHQTGSSSADDEVFHEDPTLHEDFVTNRPPRAAQSQTARQEDSLRRTKDQDLNTSVEFPVSEPSESSTDLHPSGPPPRSRLVTQGDEPILMLYRRHSEDPFFMDDVMSCSTPKLSPRAGGGAHSSTDQRLSSAGAESASGFTIPEIGGDVDSALSGMEKGHDVNIPLSSVEEQRSRTVAGGRSASGARARNGEASHASLTGVRVGVNNKKPPPAKKMVKMQSPRVQCCMCALSVMSALLGMFMLSAGVCLVLNYNFLEVDTSGLPPNLHNEEGKKVVGIILICVGIVSLGVSGLVSILFYAACSRTSPSTPSKEGKGQSRPNSQDSSGRGHYHSNGVTQGGAGRRSNGAAAAAALPNGRRGNDPRSRGGAAALTPGAKDGAGGYARSGKAGRNGATPPGPGRPYRPGKKNHHHRHGQGRFRNSLPSHPEEAGGESHGLGESGRSSARHLAYPERSGHVNEGARLDDEVAASRENLASRSSESSVTPSVVIKVDSSYLTDSASAAQTPPQQEESDPELAKHSSGVLGASASVTVTSEVDVTETRDAREEEEESGRMSRSTVDSSDTTDGADESPEDAQRRLDSQINTLISERL